MDGHLLSPERGKRDGREGVQGRREKEGAERMEGEGGRGKGRGEELERRRETPTLQMSKWA